MVQIAQENIFGILFAGNGNNKDICPISEIPDGPLLLD